LRDPRVDRKRNSEKLEPEHKPIEPEMPKGVVDEDVTNTPAGDPAKEKRSDEL
jgi:hypothetical protein